VFLQKFFEKTFLVEMRKIKKADQPFLLVGCGEKFILFKSVC